MTRRAAWPQLFIVVAMGWALGCGASPTPPARSADPEPVSAEGLHNVFRLSDRIYSGSSPDGDAGFASLKRLGIRTVLTVDGMTPDVATAERYGLRYVHIPVGYDGIPQDRAWRIARAVRDLPGPVYVHCHHGMHRGPAAIACVMLALDPTYTPERASAWLKLAGTDPRFRGLVGLPQTFHRPTAADLDRVPADFPATSSIPDLAKLMVAVDGHSDNLKAAKAAGWRRPADNPDVDPTHEAVQLAELFREAGRLPAATGRGDEFLSLLREAEAAAGDLEKALRANPVNGDEARRAFERSQSLCNRCHAKFRN